MIKAWILFSLITNLLFTKSAEAQLSLGVEGGISNNYLHYKTFNQSFSRLNNSIGFCFGSRLQYKMSKKRYIEIGSAILQKNYSISRTGIFAGAFEMHRNTYSQFSVMMKYRIISKPFQFYIKGGGYMAYWMKGQVTGKIPDVFSVSDSINQSGQIQETIQLRSFNKKYEFDGKKDNRIELGYISEIEMQYSINKRSSIATTFSVYQSLTDQQKKYMLGVVPRYNQTMLFMLKYLFAFD